MELDAVHAALTGGAKPGAPKPTRHEWFDGGDYPRPPADARYTMARLKLPKPNNRRALHWVVVVTWHDATTPCEVFDAEQAIVVEPGSQEWGAAWACGHCVPWARDAWKPEDGADSEAVRPRDEQLKLFRANDR